MSYIEERSENVQNLHNIYSLGKNIPDFIKNMLDVPELLRLNGIDQNSGLNLSGFIPFNYKYSTLDHSLGVALILNNFITNNHQVTAALLHELAAPAFLASTKIIEEKNFDPKEQPLTVYDAIVGSDILFDRFTKDGISIESMCDYTTYPLAYNLVPHLSANRLEYLLHTMLFMNIRSIDEVEKMYNSLIVVPNEENMPEFCFNDIKLAQDFCISSLECGQMYRSYEAKATMKFISDTLGAMVRREVISRKDLYTYSDRVIMEIGLSCSDKRISDRWKYLSELNKVYTKFNKDDEKHWHSLYLEEKYVDPLVRLDDGTITRVSKVSEICKNKINTFLNSDTDLYFKIDYED